LVCTQTVKVWLLKKPVRSAFIQMSKLEEKEQNKTLQFSETEMCQQEK
jgi:hypothetical protein